MSNKNTREINWTFTRCLQKIIHVQRKPECLVTQREGLTLFGSQRVFSVQGAPSPPLPGDLTCQAVCSLICACSKGWEVTLHSFFLHACCVLRSLIRLAFLPVPPSVRARQSTVNATANLSQSVTLICDADGFPEPTMSWTK